MSQNHPDAPDIYQPEAPAPINMAPVPVVAEGPIRTQELPAKSAGYRTYFLDTVVPQKILMRDFKRKQAIIIVADKAGQSRGAALGDTQAMAAENTGANIPLYGTGVSTAFVAAPITVSGVDEVWAIACGTACTISVINEQWSE
jgi:hypothetical protein